jgi:hypothetical protein
VRNQHANEWKLRMVDSLWQYVAHASCCSHAWLSMSGSLSGSLTHLVVGSILLAEFCCVEHIRTLLHATAQLGLGGAACTTVWGMLLRTSARLEHVI